MGGTPAPSTVRWLGIQPPRRLPGSIPEFIIYSYGALGELLRLSGPLFPNPNNGDSMLPHRVVERTQQPL